MSQLTFGRGQEVVPAGAGADWQWQEKMPSAADFKAIAEYFRTDFEDDFNPFRKDNKGKWDPKPLLRIGSLIGMGTLILAGCNLLQNLEKSPDDNQATPTPGDCPWLTSAITGLTSEISSMPMLVIDQHSLTDPGVLQQEVSQCLDKGSFQRIVQDEDLALIGMIAPSNENGIQPIWAVVDKSASEVTAPLMLFNADRNKTTVSQNGAEVLLQLHPVSIQDGKIVGNEGLDQATLADTGDGSYRLDHNNRSLNLTADELGQMTGGGFLIGAMEEFKSAIAANQLEFSQATRFDGVSPREFLGIEKPQGAPETLPQDVLRLAMDRGLRPVYYGAATDITSFCNAQSCEAMLYDHLVNGALISESTDGQVIYVLPGQPATTAFYKFDGLPVGVRPAFFIAGDNNQYGVDSGTVMALFYRGGKTGAEVLNSENPLKPLVDEPNRAEVTITDKGLTMTTFDANGQVLKDGLQEVLFLENPQQIAAIMNLNPERQYIFSDVISDTITTKYLVDTFNNANMAKWDSGISEWVETTLEEKYGHLVPNDRKMFSIISYGNSFFPDRALTELRDRRWESLHLFTWSNGNVKTVESFNEDLQKNIVNVFGEVLFRDIEGKIHLLRVRFDVIDPTTQFRLPVCSIANKNNPTGDSYNDYCGSMNLLTMSSLKEEMDYYSKPGQPLFVSFSVKVPETPPKYKDFGKGYVNTRYVANYYDWVKNKELYQTLADALVKKLVPDDLPGDFVLAAQEVAIYMDIDELIRIYK